RSASAYLFCDVLSLRRAVRSSTTPCEERGERSAGQHARADHLQPEVRCGATDAATRSKIRRQSPAGDGHRWASGTGLGDPAAARCQPLPADPRAKLSQRPCNATTAALTL